MIESRKIGNKNGPISFLKIKEDFLLIGTTSGSAHIIELNSLENKWEINIEGKIRFLDLISFNQ